jgi:hypothetical protein
MSTIFFPVAGFTVGKVFPDTESTNSLLMNNCETKGKEKLNNSSTKRGEMWYKVRDIHCIIFVPLSAMHYIRLTDNTTS